MKIPFFHLSLLLLTTSCSHSDDTKIPTEPKTIATYTIVFTNYWNDTDHGPFPNNPHWSPLVGANHNSTITYLQVNGIANQGIEDIAETGVSTNFKNDVLLSIANGTAEQYIDGGGLFLSNDDSITIDSVEMHEDFPLLTLLSMIAPSPDWIVFVNGFNLRNDSDTGWKQSENVDLFVYDAGTDSATTYNAPNADISPHLPISSLKGVSPFNNAKVATLQITLQKVDSLSE